ncbi:MAG: cell envelope integrity protein TolA [Rhodospirillales bacterium]
MRTSLIISVALHVGLVLSAWLGLPLTAPEPLLDEQPVFVEIVDVDEVRNAPPIPVQETPKEKAKAEPPKPPAPPKPKPAPPPPQPEVAALPPKPEPEPEPLPKAEPEPKPEPEPEKKEAEPKPEPKPEPPKPQLAQVKVPKKPKRPEKPAFDTASVLKTLEKIKKQPPKSEEEPEKKKKPEPLKDDTMAKIRAALQNNSKAIKFDPTKKVSQLEIDQWRTMIRNQVSKCWSPPYGAPGAEKLKPELRLTLNPDGSVQSVEVEDTARTFTDRYYQVAVEAARRAVLDPRCNKFSLPADKHHVWRDLKFIFDPSGML